MRYESLRDAPWNRKPRQPLRTVAEIAEVLGIPWQRLQRALMREDAPKKAFRSKEMSHATGPNRVWYEPRAVIRWYTDVVIPDDLAHPERAYRRAQYKAGGGE